MALLMEMLLFYKREVGLKLPRILQHLQQRLDHGWCKLRWSLPRGLWCLSLLCPKHLESFILRSPSQRIYLYERRADSTLLFGEFIRLTFSRLPDFSQIQVPGRRNSSGRTPSATASTSSSAEDQNDPVWIRDMLLANPDQVALLKQHNPRLADALNNPEEFAKVKILSYLFVILWWHISSHYRVRMH